VAFGLILWQILDFRGKQWIKDILKCSHGVRTTNIGLLYPNVRIGGAISIDVPQPKYWRGYVPGIRGGVDASAEAYKIQSCPKSGTPFYFCNNFRKCTVQDRTIVTMTDYRKSYTRFRLVPKSSTLDDLERPWTAKTHSVAEKMRILGPTAQIYIKIEPYCQQQKCRPMTIVFLEIGYMRILVGVPLDGASNESGVVDDGNFWRFEWILLRKL